MIVDGEFKKRPPKLNMTGKLIKIIIKMLKIEKQNFPYSIMKQLSCKSKGN